MKTIVYIINNESRASTYGIGTYINQLKQCFNGSEILFEIVQLFSTEREVQRIRKEDHFQINIPSVVYQNTKKSSCYYGKAIAYLLRDLIAIEKSTKYIFHLNFMTNECLVKNLKRLFKCKIILVAHYSNWSFSYIGNEEKFQNLMRKSHAGFKTAQDQKIYKETKEDFRMIALCDRFVCVARHTLETLNKVKPMDKVTSLVIPNAIKDTYTYPTQEQKRKLRTSWHLSSDAPIILFAGRLDEVKGVDYLIEAFKLTRTTHPAAHLFIAGEGNFAKLLDLSEKHWAFIHFTGRINKQQLYELYCMANVGVVCSLHEEFGLVALEMMMHELPIIVTDTGGLSEIVVDGVSGIKIPLISTTEKRSIDTNLLSEKINTLLEHPDEACLIARNGRKQFLETYELGIFKERMLSLYRDI